MNRLKDPTPNEFYRLEVQGALDAAWADWLDGAVIHIQPQTDATANTAFIVKVPDQSALRGLLGRLWDLNLTLISLQKLELSAVAVIIEKTATQEISGGAK
jgi:hypothetical protein